MASVMKTLINNTKPIYLYNFKRFNSASVNKKGLVLGVYAEKDGEDFVLSKEAEKFDSKIGGKLTKQLKLGPTLKLGKSRVLWDLTPDFPAVCVVGAGSRCAAYNDEEDLDEGLENVRIAAGAGCRALQECGVGTVLVDSIGWPKAAAEGAHLANYLFQAYKNEKKRRELPQLQFYGDESDVACWDEGKILAESQNWARTLMETPANLLTPTAFAKQASAELGKIGVKVTARDKAWAEKMKMSSFLSVAQGSAQPPVFLELEYKNAKDEGNTVLVGKGVTFDTGGISIKPSAGMASMRADMGGAACVVATLRAAAILKLPLNIVGLIPLTENMPGSRATKPGDVFVAMNGKSIEVDNTDAEGRLILADALCYAETFTPQLTVDIATLTGAARVALGDAATAAFTPRRTLAAALADAAAASGDRVWRMPLYRRYSNRMTSHSHVDVHNVGKGGGGGSCTAAAFLREFAPAATPWLHLDIAPVMTDCEDQSYLGKGMTGRPVRTLVEFVRNFKPEK